jgi:hypothetical protein
MLKARCRVGSADEASRGLEGLIERQINAGSKEADAVRVDSIASPDDDVVRGKRLPSYSDARLWVQLNRVTN